MIARRHLVLGILKLPSSRTSHHWELGFPWSCFWWRVQQEALRCSSKLTCCRVDDVVVPRMMMIVVSCQHEDDMFNGYSNDLVDLFVLPGASFDTKKSGRNKKRYKPSKSTTNRKKNGRTLNNV